ncbi:DUF6591 domain-containing protein [Bifidobacterium gallicum]|uniref:Putative chemotaxis sensory transducer n=1 Tax=Bifidobacterium gallicum DSM 20093 = LMG 11596 TaxID=561180 RepID=D1NUN2_9BIFI|nr:DUF6591 domain-containing protein [Bifidobacterium gallicum]EFA22533.1 hypothetical protein BIFGAL_03558 [Bifidobacterium gallicum DSM 20093 = LMG 11596]KFI59524.1 putative chemotaxis sensory transducer [Bifidobacterium gallicum DSM 20093 = LMG 11596]
MRKNDEQELQQDYYSVDAQIAQRRKKTIITVIIGVVVAALVTVGILFATIWYPAIVEQRAREAAATSAVTPSTTEPMEVIKNYEQFMMDYADYAEMLNSAEGIPADKLEGYTQWLARFDDIQAQFDAVSDTKLTPEQEAYFDDVIDRVNKRMIEATGTTAVAIPRSAEEAEKLQAQREEEAEKSRNQLTDALKDAEDSDSGDSADSSDSSQESK